MPDSARPDAVDASSARPDSARPMEARPSPPPRNWVPPWPPIQISTSEWILMRDERRTPAAIVRALRLGARHELFYRVVSWAPTSEGRELIGYFRTLDEADRSVLFTPDLPGSAMQPVRPDGVAVTRSAG